MEKWDWADFLMPQLRLSVPSRRDIASWFSRVLTISVVLLAKEMDVSLQYCLPS